MINTDKYEGHTPAPWRLEAVDDDVVCVVIPQEREIGKQYIAIKPINSFRYGQWDWPDARLLADAPLLLAEVLRLRGLLQQVADEYTDADGITYEIYCEFGGEEE